MMRLGLLGWPVSHSFSPRLHNAALNAVGIEGEYRLYPVEPDRQERLSQIMEMVRGGELNGLNVTIPYKQAVFAFMDELTPIASQVGAVNTIYMKDGRLVGDNTDAPGFMADLRKKSGRWLERSGRAVVFGAGGSARAVVSALVGASWHVTIAARNADQAGILVKSFNRDARTDIVQARPLSAPVLGTLIQDVRLIVNTTPVGMFPKINLSAWPEGLFWPSHAFVYDLIYNPKQTRLMIQAQTEGLRAVNGLGMLIEQAALAFEIWTGTAAPRDVMASVVSAGTN